MGYGKKAVHIAIQLTGQKRFGSANCQLPSNVIPFQQSYIDPNKGTKNTFSPWFLFIILRV